MTGEEIREHFQWLVDDDTLDEDRELVLLNVAYDELNLERHWIYLATSQESLTIAAGDTTYALVADFGYTVKVTLFDGSKTYREFTPVPWRKRLEYKNVSGHYYVDIKNSQIVFTSTDDMTTYAGWTLIHDYQYQPAQLTNSTSPVFNRAYHALLAYQMAKHYFFNDQGEKSRAWNTEFNAEYKMMKQKMEQWDAMLDFAVNPHTNATDAFNLE